MSDPGDEMWDALDDAECAIRALRVLLRDEPHGRGVQQQVSELRDAVRAVEDISEAAVRARRPDLWVSR